MATDADGTLADLISMEDDTSLWPYANATAAANLTNCTSIDQMMWDRYSDVTTRPPVRWAIGLVYATIIVAAVVANSLLITVILGASSLRSSTSHLLVACLAATDIAVALTSGVITPYNVLSSHWSHSQLACKGTQFMQGVSMFVCQYTLAVIGLDRYLLICRSRSMTKLEAFTLLAVSWLVAAVCVGPSVWSFRKLSIREMCDWVCAEDWEGVGRGWLAAYSCADIVCRLLLPLATIAFCYARCTVRIKTTMAFRRVQFSTRVGTSCGLAPGAIGCRRGTSAHYPTGLPRADSTYSADSCSAAVQQAFDTAEDNSSKGGDSGSSNTLRAVRQLRRLARTNRLLITMVITFGLLWTPQVTYSLFLPLLELRQANLITLVTHSFAMLSTISNAILYGAYNQSVRRVLRAAAAERSQRALMARAVAAEAAAAAAAVVNGGSGHSRAALLNNEQTVINYGGGGKETLGVASSSSGRRRNTVAA